MRTVHSVAADPPLESLSEEECLKWLEHHDFGRLALVVDGQPLIFPVNYAVCKRVIAIRTAPGTKLTYAPGSRVAFEIDGYDPSSQSGWSVLAQGEAVDASMALDDVSWTSRGAIPHPAVPGPKPYRLAIKVATISGRRFGSTPAKGERSDANDDCL